MAVHNSKQTKQIIDWFEARELEVIDTSYGNDLCDSIEVNGYRINLPNSFIHDLDKLFKDFQVMVVDEDELVHLVNTVSSIEEVYELIKK